MALDGLVVASIVEELKSLLCGNKIEKVYQPEADELILLIRSQGKNLKLLLSSGSQYPRVHFSKESKENPVTPPNFCMLLRKHLQGGRIISIEQPHFERIIQLGIEAYDELNVLKQKRLIIEIMGKHSNIILVDQETNRIIDSIKRISIDVSRYRQVLPGLTYEMPPSQDKVNPLTVVDFEEFHQTLSQRGQTAVYKAIYTSFTGVSPLIAREICFRANVTEDAPILSLTPIHYQQLFESFRGLLQKVKNKSFTPTLYLDAVTGKFADFHIIQASHMDYYQSKGFDTISELLEAFYHHNDSRERMKQKNQTLRKNISLKLDRLIHKIENLKQDLKNAEKAEELKVLGDLITANIHLLGERASEVKVINYFDPSMEEITIQLDKRLTPSQNAQKYYKQYNKYKTAMKEVTHQIEIALEEVQYLEQILVSIDHASQLSDIEEIQSELMETGYLKRKLGRKANPQTKKHGYLKYQTSDGLEVLVGKNNKQNDEITFKLSSKNDLWLHVKDLPGSHTILKLSGSAYSDQALLEAATLAAFYSKGKNATKVAVDYTLRKNVKKTPGAKPGMVIYENYQTIYVDADLSTIKDIKELK